MSEPTAEQRAEWSKWVAERPPSVQAVAVQFPPWICIRDASTGRGHYIVLAFAEPEGDEPVTLRVAHGADSFMPGFEVFGIAPEDMRMCGCGAWSWPSEEQAAESSAEADAFIAAVDAAGLKIEPGLKLISK